jgi:CRISPR-associated protein Csd1
MIQELVELSKRLPRGHQSYDALDTVPVSVDCVIDKKGNFRQFNSLPEKVPTIAERIAAKKGKARLLVDKPEEVLNWGERAEKKHQLFLQKLTTYMCLPELAAVSMFYGKNRKNGLEEARKQFPWQVEEKLRTGNIAFLCQGDLHRLHEQKAVYDAIIEAYDSSQKGKSNPRFGQCSICGSSSFPIVDDPHGMIKRVPDGQSSGCALVSYNDTAYESYGLKGNENSSICTRCARSYVDALNWLLSTGSSSVNEKGKEVFAYKHRRKISDDTAVVFWLQNAVEISDLDLLDEPDAATIHTMIDSLFGGRASSVRTVETEKFYAVTLSGSAARIAVRDWIETSVENLRTNLAHWFHDIQIGQYDWDKKAIVGSYPRFWELVRAQKSKSSNDVIHGRFGTALWKCAVLGTAPPLWILSSVLNRMRAEQGIKADEGKRSVWETNLPERVALLRLSLNRQNSQQGGILYMATLDDLNKNAAYICGRLFAVLESVQFHASGGTLNAGIRERFFSFASTMPSAAFGRLMKLAQHHLSKVRGERPGLAVNLDKQIQELMCRIEGSSFPAVFSLEEQASFAMGYYHQRQNDFAKKTNPIGGSSNE